MSPLERLFFTVAVILVFPALGWLCRREIARGAWPLTDAKFEKLRLSAQSAAIFVLMPLSASLSLWGLPRPDGALFLLPALGLAAYLWGGSLAWIAARALKMDKREQGAYYCCGTFSNVAAVGGLICLIFLGENAIALVALYRVLEEIFYFGVSFPVAAACAPGNAKNFLNLRRVAPALCAIVLALALGLWLNYSGARRPPILGPVAASAMFAATTIFLFAIGANIKLSSVRRYRLPALVMCAIKFAGIPLVVAPLAVVLGLGAYDDGLILKTAFVLSAMPVAMTALAPPSLFNLDVDLANACWIVTTLGLIPALPIIVWLLPYL